MNVLSLFDGMSCGQIALERAGISVESYFSSEIDKYAIKVTQSHYPNTVQLGNILDWKLWKLPQIDLLLAGSPCQGFSQSGKGLNFNDPRSKLFFEFLKIRDFLLSRNSDLMWMLENVRMKGEWRDKITELVGVQPVLIDSALVSAQSRKRLYWANFEITQPRDKGILLRSIIENGVADRDKSFCIDANYYKGGNYNQYVNKSRRQLDKLPSKQSQRRGGMVRTFLETSPHGYMKKKITEKTKYPSLAAQDPSTKYKVGLIFVGGISGKDWAKDGKKLSRNFPQGHRIYSENGKSATLSSQMGGIGGPTGIYEIEGHYRKLTPVECERLQTVPDNWTNMVSNTQRYKMLGNGWTVDVIAHILKGMV